MTVSWVSSWQSDRKSSLLISCSGMTIPSGFTLIEWFGSPYTSTSMDTSISKKMEADVVKSYMMSGNL